jgi:hypothetical protein
LVAKESSVSLLKTYDFFKQGDTFFMARGRTLYYRDNNHLTSNGSLYIAESLRDSGQLNVF